MTPDHDRPPDQGWGDDPPPFTAEELEDLRANGHSLTDLIAELEQMADPPPARRDDDPTPTEDRP